MVNRINECMLCLILCSGLASVPQSGCWIGLQSQGGSIFDWIDPETVNTTSSSNGLFYDWRRFEPNNHTVSEGNSR